MLAAAFAITIQTIKPISPTGSDLVRVEARLGPSKTGFYIVDLFCPGEGGDLIVMEMNESGQTRRTKGTFIAGSTKGVTIEAAENGGAYKTIFPDTDKFTDKQLTAVSKNIRGYLDEIYRDICTDQDGNKGAFLTKVRENNRRLTNSTP